MGGMNNNTADNATTIQSRTNVKDDFDELLSNMENDFPETKNFNSPEKTETKKVLKKTQQVDDLLQLSESGNDFTQQRQVE